MLELDINNIMLIIYVQANCCDGSCQVIFEFKAYTTRHNSIHRLYDFLPL